MIKSFYLTFCLIPLLVVLSACTSSLSGSRSCQPDLTLLQDRAAKVWDLKLNDQWTDIFDYVHETYRKNHKKENFAKASNVKIKSFNIETVTPDPDNPGRAIVAVKFIINQMGYDFPFVDKGQWVFENCNWYIVMEEEEKPKKNIVKGLIIFSHSS